MPRKRAALLLAAGRSTRMGVCKQLLPLPERPALLRCLDTIRAAGVEEIVVVVGPDAAAIRAVLHGLPVTVALNPESGGDMASSVRAGLAALSPHAAAVLVCLADHPLVRETTLHAILGCGDTHPDEVIIPVCSGRKGHPTLFPRQILAAIDHCTTLREVIARQEEAVRLLPVSDDGVYLDMDTLEEYRRLLVLAGQPDRE